MMGATSRLKVRISSDFCECAHAMQAMSKAEHVIRARIT